MGGSSGERSEANTPSPMPSTTFWSAPTRYERKRAGSLSDSSRKTQAPDLPLPDRSTNHSTNRVVFPKPAGAETSVSLRPSPRPRSSCKRARSTRFGRVLGTRSVVFNSVWGTALSPKRGPKITNLKRG